MLNHARKGDLLISKICPIFLSKFFDKTNKYLFHFMKQYQFKTLNLPVQNTFTSNSFTNKESYTNNNQSVIAPTSVYRNYHE